MLPSPTEPGFQPPTPTSRWRRWFIEPVLRQLRAGISPEKIALTVALGFVLGVFPILGSTTLLVTAAAALLRLNQPIIQLVNYVAYPVQLLAIIPFYRYGQRLFGQQPLSLSISFLLERFRADLGKFFRDFSLIALEGIALWCLLAPLAAAAIYCALRPLLRASAARLSATAASERIQNPKSEF